MMKKNIAKLSTLLAICLLAFAATTIAQAKPLTYVPPNFSVTSYFSGSGASRAGVCITAIQSTGASYRAAVNCEMQTNAGARIDYDSASGSYGGYGVGVIVNNLIGDTGRLVLFSTHNMWVNSTNYVEYRIVESLN